LFQKGKLYEFSMIGRFGIPLKGKDFQNLEILCPKSYENLFSHQGGGPAKFGLKDETRFSFAGNFESLWKEPL